MSEAIEQQARRLGELLASSELEPGVYSRERPPVVYFSTGRETMVLTGAAEAPREVASFHSPQALASSSGVGALSAEVAQLPPDLPAELRSFQVEAIRALEASLASGERRALLSVATGGGRIEHHPR